MSPLTESLKSTLRKTLSFLVRFAPVRWALAGWYRLSLKGLALIVRGKYTGNIKAIFNRHQNWILGISDIDLIIFYDDPDPAQDRRLFISFWRRYRILRLIFPMLCGVSEVRWIPLQRLAKHPLHTQAETHLLLNPEQWSCVFSSSEDPALTVPVFDPPMEPGLPLTMFLDFNLYGYIQKQLFSNEAQPSLRVDRMAKCAVKITQHLHYLQSGEYITVPELQETLARPSEKHPWEHYAQMLGGLLLPRAGQQDRDREIARSFYNTLLDLSRVHETLLHQEDPKSEPVHQFPGEWQGSDMEDFVREVEQRFASRLTLVSYKSPYKQYHRRLFLVITPETSFEDYFAFIGLARSYEETFQEQKIILNVTTPVLLTSQFYGLWGHVALEAYILAAQPVYAPRGGLKLCMPEEQWTLQKIRESVAVFEEFYLPFMMSPLAKGEGMDFCKIYERAETEMLFHYYGYLKDRQAYLGLMTETAGSVDEVITWACARFGNEIGIQDWHPFRFIDSYPCLKKMIRQIDEMALRQLESGTSETQYST